MSNKLYFLCTSHESNHIRSDEIGRNQSWFREIREDFADRVSLTAAYDALQGDITGFFDHYKGERISFLADHENCEIQLWDEYGRRYSLLEGNDEPLEDQNAVEVPQKIIHVATFREGMAVPRCFEEMVFRRDDMAHEATCPECVADAKKVGLIK